MGTLLVAGAGGHLEEMYALRERLRGIDGPTAWVTWPTETMPAFLADEEVLFADYPPPRSVRTAVANATRAREILRSGDWDDVVTTGSSLAVSFVAAGRALGRRCHYIESATRTKEPSLSGRILEHVPGVHLYAQHAGWKRRKWAFRGSVFDNFARGAERPCRIRKAVVTLGTNPTYGFRRLVEGISNVLGPDTEVLWQTGPTNLDGLGIEARPYVDHETLRCAIYEADLVVAHAGIGSAFEAFRAGRCPLLVPRRLEHGEHVDDHQEEIACLLAEQGLCIAREADQLSEADLFAAAFGSVVRRPNPAPFFLGSAEVGH